MTALVQERTILEYMEQQATFGNLTSDELKRFNEMVSSAEENPDEKCSYALGCDSYAIVGSHWCREHTRTFGIQGK